jgi:DNA-binding response OmpR family regulator
MGPVTKKVTVVVIEQESELRTLVAKLLSSAGVTVLEAPSARAALERMLLLGLRPAAVLVGVEVGGERILRALQRRGVPVVRLCAAGKHLCDQLGAVAVRAPADPSGHACGRVCVE